ncbi:MAG: SpoIIE family protein phosphatase [Candidatus Competibacterales bacterium]|nr:SpoIIE family protein phosphatase [Candidatus Competibacterales bacterium]
MSDRGPAVLLDVSDAARPPLIQLLRQQGYRLLKRGANSADVIVYDLAQGFENLDRRLRATPRTPVVTLSDRGDTDEAVRAFRAGASDYLAPPHAEVLPAALQRALSRNRQQQREQRRLRSLEQDNQQLLEHLETLHEDEESGRRLQFQLLPPERQSFGPYRFSRQLWTSLYLSGDFVDYFKIDDTHTGFYMADVAGHGVSPAMITVLLKSYMNRYLELYRQDKNQGILDPARIFARINYNILKSDMGKHLTMCYGVIEHPSNRLTYCNAGQFPYPMLFNGQRACYQETHDKPLGLFDFAQYRNVVLQLPERFAFALLSDGILELLRQSQIKEKLTFLLGLFENDRVNLTAFGERLGLNRNRLLPDDVTLLLVKRGL